MEKIKQFIQSGQGKDIMVALIVVLVGLGAFLLGRLSKEYSTSGIQIEYLNQPPIEQSANVISATKSSSILQKTRIVTPKPAVAPVASVPTVKNFFASNRGNKYYPVGCSAGKTIKQENRVYFATREEAEGAGYELSRACD